MVGIVKLNKMPIEKHVLQIVACKDILCLLTKWVIS
jgi:hypothetical protein